MTRGSPAAPGARPLLWLLVASVTLSSAALRADTPGRAAGAARRAREPGFGKKQQLWIDRLTRSLAPRLRRRVWSTVGATGGKNTGTVEIEDDCRGSMDPRYGKRSRLRVYDEKEFVAAATRISRNKPVGSLMPLYTVIRNADPDGKPTGEVTVVDIRGTRTTTQRDARVFTRVPLSGFRKALSALYRTPERSRASGLGDLSQQEATQIQSVVDRMGCGGLLVGGSAARGARRNRGRHWLPIGKGPGTRSDIDYFAYGKHLGRIDDLALPELAGHRIVNLDNVVVHDGKREVDIKEAISNRPLIVFRPHQEPRMAGGKLPTFDGPAAR